MLRPDPSSPFVHSHALAGGGRVRLRMPQRRDRPALTALLARALDVRGGAHFSRAGRGSGAGTKSKAPRPPEPSRLVRHDPRQRAVICASVAEPQGAERLVGVGSIACEPDAEPELVLLEGGADPAIGPLLADALRDRVRPQRRRAA